MNLSAEKTVYDVLRQVYSNGAYSAQALNRALKSCTQGEKPYITMLFYGVLDKSVQFDYIIAKIADRKPQVAVMVLLKMGLYLLRYTDTPNYAAVHKTVELAKLVGKSGASGFVNAALKQSERLELPSNESAFGLSVVASYPEWIVKKIVADYGFQFAKELLMFTLPTETHIRVNRNRISIEEFETKYPKATQHPSKLGHYVTHTMLKQMKNTDYLIQSLSSMFAVQQYIQGFEPKNALDLCAAPGGKSVYLKECKPNCAVTACDIHPHRVALMQKYAQSANANLTIMQNDATVYREEFANQFDLVVCDVPCSGIGVASKKPEILWNCCASDIRDLAKLQMDILTSAARYVAVGGRLSYSTCTVFLDENERVCEQFLSMNPNFTLQEPFLKLFPHIDGCDGFFVANLKRCN